MTQPRYTQFDFSEKKKINQSPRPHHSLRKESPPLSSGNQHPKLTESELVSRGLGSPARVNGPAKRPSKIDTTQTTAQARPQLFTRKLFATEKHSVGIVIGKFEELRADSGQVDSVVISIQRLLFI
ncbi:hypothetical protein Bca101_091108 [Brassica carinata]